MAWYEALSLLVLAITGFLAVYYAIGVLVLIAAALFDRYIGAKTDNYLTDGSASDAMMVVNLWPLVLLVSAVAGVFHPIAAVIGFIYRHLPKMKLTKPSGMAGAIYSKVSGRTLVENRPINNWELF